MNKDNFVPDIYKILSRVWAFTLIELLITIAIMAILASILFPALNKAKARGNEILCMSNQRQFGLVVTAYLDTYDYYMPLYYDGSNLWTKRLIDSNILSWPKDHRIMICPSSAKIGFVDKSNTYGQIYYMLKNNFDDNGIAYKVKGFKAGHYEKSLSRVGVFSDSIRLMANSDYDKMHAYYWPSSTLTTTSGSYGHLIHLRRMNMWFLDAHVESVSREWFSKYNWAQPGTGECPLYQ